MWGVHYSLCIRKWCFGRSSDSSAQKIQQVPQCTMYVGQPPDGIIWGSDCSAQHSIVSVPNGSDSEGEGPLTLHIVVPATITAPPRTLLHFCMHALEIRFPPESSEIVVSVDHTVADSPQTPGLWTPLDDVHIYLAKQVRSISNSDDRFHFKC